MLTNKLDAKAFLGDKGRGTATEEEISEFILLTLKELAIMTCSVAMPLERKKQFEEAVTLFEGCAGLYRNHPGERLGSRDAANDR